MADALIETVASNPYESIVADTSTKISDLDSQISQVTSAINKLEQVSPTSPTLPQLRERLSSLQSQRQWLSKTNDSAKSLMTAYNNSVDRFSSLRWVYWIKQEELAKDKWEAQKEFDSMAEDTRRVWQNYVNALGNATASENAIINANAGREWASSQSVAEARARNYLNNAATQNEAANNTLQNVNAIREAKITSDQWYTQLSQSNADNYLRQQIMNDYQSAENQKDRDLQYALTKMQLDKQWSWWTKIQNVVDPSKFTEDQRETVIKYINDATKDNDENEDKEVPEKNKWR